MATEACRIWVFNCTTRWMNPLSAPFWSRMGYRPLWTGWEVRPAASLR